MAYRKRYEDSYLDEEDEEFAGDDRTDGDKLVELILKQEASEKDEARKHRLTERLFMAARMPATPGALAVVGIANAAEAYVSIGKNDAAVDLWSRVSEIAEINGDRDLYYRALDEMTNAR